jgi:hypothetical protein
MADGDKGRIGRVAQVIQSLLTSAAILIGGWWFISERKSIVHADIKVEATGARISKNLILVQGTIETKNVGHVVLETKQWVIRLTRVIPSDLPVEEIAKLGIRDWPEKLSKAPNAPTIYEHQQLEWYKLREISEPDERTVEPGETDIRHVDFIIPCSVALASFSAWVQKPAAKHWFGLVEEKEQWWSARTLLPLSAVCRTSVGSAVKLVSAPQ